MSSSEDIPSLISLNPPEILVFKLERNLNAKSVLKVTNISQQKVVFKVKTTQPSWYYVRPNQQILDIGQTEDIAIVLVEAECNRFLDQVVANKAEKLDKHRFLVQSKAISDEEYDTLIAMPAALRTDEYAKLWDANAKDDKKNIKLKVEFQLSTSAQGAPKVAEKGGSQENAETVRRQFERMPSEYVSGDNVKSEYETLKKKYDAVVEYTVHLTAERDNIVAQLEEAQRDLSREITKRRANAAGDITKTAVKDKVEKKSEAKGFSLTVVLVIAFIFFAVGRYFGISTSSLSGSVLPS